MIVITTIGHTWSRSTMDDAFFPKRVKTIPSSHENSGKYQTQSLTPETWTL